MGGTKFFFSKCILEDSKQHTLQTIMSTGLSLLANSPFHLLDIFS